MMDPDFADFIFGVLVGALAVAVVNVFLYISRRSKKRRK